VQNWPPGEQLQYQPGELHPLVAALPWYREVPKDPLEHFEWRVKLYEKAATDTDLQQDLLQACADDLLFYINSFCFIYEPRDGVLDCYGNPVYGNIPFNTWRHQDPLIAGLQKYFGKRHIVERKSREQGASWKVLAAYSWAWRFRKHGCVLGMGSETMQKADDPARHGSLGWKFDFILKNLPKWMLPRGWDPDKHRRVSSHTWENPDTGALLYAESATENIGRSDRYTSFFLDEAGFFMRGYDQKAIVNLLATTNQILLISSSNDENTEHFRILSNPGPWLTYTLDWKDNPVHNIGKYTAKKGKLVVLDEGYEFPPDYEFILDGRIRSVWYDRKWRESSCNAKLMAREYDMDFGGASGKPFNPATIERFKTRCREPLSRGDLLAVPSNLKDSQWQPADRGPIALWVPLVDGKPPRMRLACGCDLGAGTGGSGSSNSTAIFIDMVTRRQVAEVVRNDMYPDHFAEYVYAICAWFGWGEQWPVLNWERNAMAGGHFTAKITELGYKNLHYQSEGDEFRPYAKPGVLPGYHNSNKAETMRPLILAMNDDTVELLSLPLILECGEYVFVDGVGGKIEHPKSRTAFDASESGENHGDRAVGAAICVRALEARKTAATQSISDWQRLHQAPPGSTGHRIYQASLETADALSCEW
jgi:hypothetical protein